MNIKGIRFNVGEKLNMIQFLDSTFTNQWDRKECLYVTQFY